MHKDIEIIALIYQSVDYLNFIANQLKSPFCKALGWDVGIRIIANDATPNVLEHLKRLDIPYSIYNNNDPNF